MGSLRCYNLWYFSFLLFAHDEVWLLFYLFYDVIREFDMFLYWLWTEKLKDKLQIGGPLYLFLQGHLGRETGFFSARFYSLVRGIWTQIEDLHLGVRLLADCEVGKLYLKVLLSDTFCYSRTLLANGFPVIHGSVKQLFSAASWFFLSRAWLTTIDGVYCPRGTFIWKIIAFSSCWAWRLSTEIVSYHSEVLSFSEADGENHHPVEVTQGVPLTLIVAFWRTSQKSKGAEY